MDVKEIASHFGITVAEAKRVSHAAISYVYILNGTHVLRSRVLEPGVFERFENECILLDHVRSKVSAAFPDLLSTKDSTKYFLDGELLWTAYPLIEGDVLCNWWELYNLSPEQERNTFTTLRGLHDKTAGQLIDVADAVQYRFLDDMEGKLSNPAQPLDDVLRMRVEQAIEYLRSRERDLTEEQKCFVHGDYHPGNLLFNGDTIVGLLDTDWSRKGNGIEDLAYTIMMFMRDYRKDAFTFDEAILARCLKWYGLPEDEKLTFYKYLILYAFHDVDLFDRFDTIPHPEKTRTFQRAFLAEVCSRF